MRKIYLFAFGALFISPWIQRLSYENIMLAIPNLSVDKAQGVSIIMSMLIVFAMFFFGIVLADR